MAQGDKLSAQIVAPTSQHSWWKTPIALPKDAPLPIGLDIGYSTIKIRSIYGQHIVPSFLIRAPRLANSRVSENLGGDKTDDIIYTDDRGNTWYIGEKARRHLSSGRISQDDATLYGRNRTKSPEFLVLLRVGVFFGLINQHYVLDRRPIRVTTGLPAQFLDDEVDVRQQFATNNGHHHFTIQVGNNQPMDVAFDVSDDAITVKSQPIGTIFSLVTDTSGNLTEHSDLLDSHLLVCDAGFYTVDTHEANEGDTIDSTTWDDCGMHAVYRQTIQNIYAETEQRVNLNVYQLDNYIKNACIVPYLAPSKDPSITSMIRKEHDFSHALGEYLSAAAKTLAQRLNTRYHMQDISRVVVTGGTGNLIYPYLRDVLAVDVILASRSDSKHDYDNFDPVCANVVGFFNRQMGSILQQAEKEAAATKESKPEEETGE